MTTPSTFDELKAELDGLELNDDRTLIDWLNRLFTTASELDQEIPFRDQASIEIGMARQLLPDPQLSILFMGEPAQRVTWLLTLCINALITHPATEPLGVLYRHCANNTTNWLKADR